MFRPAEDQMARMAGYTMQRSAVQEMGMMIRIEEEQMLMAQMREIEMMQMQAMGGMPSNGDEHWGLPLQQQRPTGEEPQNNLLYQDHTNTHGNANETMSTHSTSPGLAAQSTGTSLYAPNSLYATIPSTNAIDDSQTQHGPAYDRSSMYGENPSLYAEGWNSAPNEKNATTSKLPPQDVSSAGHVTEKAAPSPGTRVSAGAPKPRAAADKRAPDGPPSTATAPTSVASPPQRTPSFKPSERKASFIDNGKEEASTSTSSKYSGREIRRRNSELKRINSGASLNSGRNKMTS